MCVCVYVCGGWVRVKMNDIIMLEQANIYSIVPV